MNNHAPPVTWRQAGLRWVLASVAGYALVPLLVWLMSIVSGLLFSDRDPSGGPGPGAGGIFFLFLTLPFFFLGPIFSSPFQALVLRNYLRRPSRWIWHTLLGSLAGSVVGGIVAPLLGYILWQASPIDKSGNLAALGLVLFVPPLFILFVFWGPAAAQARLVPEMGLRAKRWFWAGGVSYVLTGLGATFSVFASVGWLVLQLQNKGG